MLLEVLSLIYSVILVVNDAALTWSRTERSPVIVLHDEMISYWHKKTQGIKI